MCKTCQDDFFKEPDDDEDVFDDSVNEMHSLYDAPTGDGTESQEERREMLGQ